jgi:hypothetical protein
MKIHVGFLLFGLLAARTNANDGATRALAEGTAMYEGTLTIYGIAGSTVSCNDVEPNTMYTWRHLEVQLPESAALASGSQYANGPDGWIQPYNETIVFMNYTFKSPEPNPTIRWVVNDGIVWDSATFGEGYNEQRAEYSGCFIGLSSTNSSAGTLKVTLNYTAISSGSEPMQNASVSSPSTSGSVFFSLMVPFVSFAAALGATLM